MKLHIIILLTIITHGKAHHLTQPDVAYIQTLHQRSFNQAMQQNTVLRNCDVGDNIWAALERRGRSD